MRATGVGLCMRLGVFSRVLSNTHLEEILSVLNLGKKRLSGEILRIGRSSVSLGATLLSYSTNILVLEFQ